MPEVEFSKRKVPGYNLSVVSFRCKIIHPESNLTFVFIEQPPAESPSAGGASLQKLVSSQMAELLMEKKRLVAIVCMNPHLGRYYQCMQQCKDLKLV